MSTAQILFDEALIKKYDQSAPRYTSYPTADRFHADFTEADYRAALKDRGTRANPLSVYVHIPFCNTVCYYCACNKIVTKDHGKSAEYIRYLSQEMRMVCDAIGDPQSRVLEQLHFGGGTPTFLSHEEMSDLMAQIKQAFSFTSDAEISIEVDPRKVTVNTVEHLSALGFNRISVGVQDFNPDVQKAVNRLQTQEETVNVIAAARKNGFHSVNIDLIYGLPLQTLDGFTETLNRVMDISPDRIALYNFAYLPQFSKPQRRINAQDIPHPDQKLKILSRAIELLCQSGYVYIGMDHFARPDDELARAQREGKLNRNFQGYTTRADGDLLAFGVSGIGKVGATYAQSVKTLEEYYAALDEQRLPILRGYALTRDDEIRRAAIQSLMCHFALDETAFGRQWGIVFDEYFAWEKTRLPPLVEDGLIELKPHTLRVTDRGRLLVRNVAMLFDRHLRESARAASYSKTI
ncbi:MAG: oxygen-independent coproporphyrinogen III oxidase [Burkholderiales bacterium]|jgi:oxygen-independent coproporphyrinogen-3 oxidase|nr:oxygen-independent coproporphyrinogen III oxidase [Burkholderiales bacterium]